MAIVQYWAIKCNHKPIKEEVSSVVALPAFAWTRHPFSSPLSFTDFEKNITILFSHGPPGGRLGTPYAMD